MGFMSGLLSAAAPIAGAAIGGPWGAAIGASLSGVASAKGASDANKQQMQMANNQMEFNAAEAEKNREFQTNQRATAYQTAVKDLQAAGLNPMLAYANGGAANTSGAQASYSNVPHIDNKVAAALTASAQQAQIENTQAQTAKTKADTAVSQALARKTEAEIGYTTNSTAKVGAETENIKAGLEEIQARISELRTRSSSNQASTFLKTAQESLALTQARLEAGRISLVEAQTEATRINANLARLELPGAENTARSNETWWGRNVRPYLGDVDKASNSAARSRYFLGK